MRTVAEAGRLNRIPPPPPAAVLRRMTDPLLRVRVGFLGLVGAAALTQLMFFPRAENNVVAVLLALAASLAGIHYALQPLRFRQHPISALILLFYTTTATAGAILVKTLEWSPLVDRLTVPLTTFSVLLACQAVLLAADCAYLRWLPLQRLRGVLANRIVMKLGLFHWPSDLQLWLLGGIGVASLLLTGTEYGGDVNFGMASAGDKLIRAFSFLKYAPFMIPFRGSLSGFPARARLPVISLGAYFVALVIISFATNSRSTFADAVPTVGICVLLALGIGRIDMKRVPPGRVLMLVVGAAVGALVLSRVALAMVVVREYRASVDVGMLVNMTFEAFFNNEWLQAAKAKMDTAITVGDYSETYVDSRFLARFLLTKFHDNIFYYFSLMGPDQIASYKGFMVDRLLGTLPDPMLRMLGLFVDKQDLVVSNGDYVVYIVDGWGMGGFKTGSMMAEVYAVFGWAFPLVLAATTCVLFIVYDAFVTLTPVGRLAVAPIVILLIWNLVGTTASIGFGTESVTQIPASILRGLPQNVVMYLIAFAFVRGVTRVLGKGR